MTNPLDIGSSSSGTQPTLHVLQGALAGQAIPLTGPEMKLGREGGDLNLSQYAQMSRSHSRLFVENGEWHIQDMGSTNGTHVNGERIVSRRLQDGDVVQMGNFKARISLPGQRQGAGRPAMTQVAPPLTIQPPTPTQHLPSPQPPQAIPSNPWPSQPAPPMPPQGYPPPQAYPPPSAYPPPIPGPQHYPPPAPPAASSGLAATGQTISTIALCLMCVGLIPCLGWLNWLAIPLGGVSAVMSLISLITEFNLPSRNTAVVGFVMGLLAACIGTVRLMMGGGVC